jgi:hypothetical protein
MFKHRTSGIAHVRTPFKRWLASWWPSTRLKRDPLCDVRVTDRYAPVSIANWKLTRAMRRHLLALRTPRPLTFETGRRLTIVVPFRDREAHLEQLVPRLKLALCQQAIPFRLLIVEQEGRELFNRGKLLNVGMHYARDDSDYYCLHDVDAVPIVANYLCPSQPLRLVNKILCEGSEMYRTDYYFSGAVSVRKDQAFAAHGFSNEYRGWGKEDDDFFFRLLLAGYLCFYDSHGLFEDLPNPRHQQVERKSPSTPSHVKQNRKRRSLLLRGLVDPANDGLDTLHYDVLECTRTPEYVRIRVRI